MSSRIRSEFGTLGERTGQPPSMAAGQPVAAYAVPARHVWLDGQHAGLLIGWQRPAGVWLGQVVWTPPEHPDAVAMDWVEADRLRQA